ncbi:P-loop containing nucleoside triphosphate hydrolase protein [Podospora fimiseda]|uniref:P-loop containing nucleoside triphosphate hydrolase protein n=1 Tax=Podospora fimiseda TaxID=252190 RepID=A0AAN7BGT8_9PEZI|nr:P-loop containing nucleoside triphosphate hydrolase protein [Podospora fimiseda]
MSVLTRPRAPTYVIPLRYARMRHPAFSTSSILFAGPRRSSYFNSGFTTSYDPTQDTGRGPIFSKRGQFGVPQFYPRDLKKRVDDYVVGQDRAKKTICSVIFNHYQGLRRRQHHELLDQNLRERIQRQKYAQDRDAFERNNPPVHPVEGGRRHPFDRSSASSSSSAYAPKPWRGQQTNYRYLVQDEFPGHSEIVRGTHQPQGPPEDNYIEDHPPTDTFYIPEDFAFPHHVKIDKSNLLLIGPTGVGKTYILETLSKKLNVPFTISDCNAFTQAGYIGQDVESCIERLLIEANYDIKAAEHGIVVLDEFDKIARKETMNGRDVGGEGVQQALLKIVEGTKVTVNVKDHRSSRNTPPSGSSTNGGGGYSGGPTTPQSSPPQGGKVDQYIVDTTNILFVFCGAFVGLDKTVLRRVSKRSIGFGSEIRSSSALSGIHEQLPREMYNHLPHQPLFENALGSPSGFTPLDLTTPADLQAFGFIPELIGRLHNICALTPLSLDELYRILTEPRNSLVAQYTELFETYPSKLHFTRLALYAIAERAAKNETGARGLKMEMERVLAEPMYDAPTPYVLITEACVNGTEKACYWGKDGRMELERRLRDEDERMINGGGEETFEQMREAGLSGA